MTSGINTRWSSKARDFKVSASIQEILLIATKRFCSITFVKCEMLIVVIRDKDIQQNCFKCLLSNIVFGRWKVTFSTPVYLFVSLS